MQNNIYLLIAVRKWPESRAVNAVLISWTYAAMIIVFAYQCNFKAVLLSPSRTKTIDTFQELSKSSSDYKITVNFGASSYDVLKDSNEPTFQKIYERVEAVANEERFGLFQTDKKIYYIGYTSEMFLANSIQNRLGQSLLRPATELILNNGVAFPMTKNAPYKYSLNKG